MVANPTNIYKIKILHLNDYRALNQLYNRIMPNETYIVAKTKYYNRQKLAY